MIWACECGSGGEREAMDRHVAGRLADWVPGVGGIWREAVSAAVVDVWERELGRRVVPDALFALLASRVLWRMGECARACEVLGRVRPGWGSGEIPSVLLGSGDRDLALLVHVAGRVVRPVAGGVLGSGPEWSLDLGRLSALVQGELGLFPRLRRLVEQVAGTWDRSGGQGGLRLRGEPGEASAACGYCREVLRRLGSERGWARVPEVRWERPTLRR
jgi:hypothetical protein